MGPLRGDGNTVMMFCATTNAVEKMGPLRGDGNSFCLCIITFPSIVEKMGPLRGDGNEYSVFSNSFSILK